MTGGTFWHWPGISSLIERGFLLQCLGNNGLEHLPTNASENGNRWTRRYCKQESWTRHWFSKIEIAGVKDDPVEWRSSADPSFRAGVLFPDAGGGSDHGAPRHGHLCSLWYRADRTGVCRSHPSAK